MDSALTRKDFVKLSGGVAMATATAAGVCAVPAAHADEASDAAGGVVWDAEYDVVVAGAGMAGMTAAIAAMNAGASVLLVEKAPEDEAGGNSRICQQLYGTVNDIEKGLEYYSAMRGDFSSTSDEVLRTYVEGMSKLDDWVIGIGADPDQITSWADCGISSYETEHPELPGGEAFEGHSIIPKLGSSSLFNLNLEYVKAHADAIEVWYSSPATRLVQDEDGTVVGVIVNRDGADVNVRARGGVCLTCGGFEREGAMVECYLGIGGKFSAYGGKYNTGDGIRMAMAAGADLWHMTNYESTGVGGNVGCLDVYFFNILNDLDEVACILVGSDGTRYVREAMNPEGMRHGHVYVAGSWTYPAYVEGSWCIVDEAGVTLKEMESTMKDDIESGAVVKADTLEELAELTGMEFVKDTVDIYNGYCEQGFDEAFRRDPATLIAFGEGPYYAIKIDTRGILNTQGGPRRDENAHIVDVWGEPIPGLYSAGELGGVTAHIYQGGGNVAECLVFGQIAGTNAAADALAARA